MQAVLDSYNYKMFFLFLCYFYIIAMFLSQKVTFYSTEAEI